MQQVQHSESQIFLSIATQGDETSRISVQNPANTSVHLAREMGADFLNALGQYRRQVFVDKLGWKLPLTPTGCEVDQFDKPDTLYVVSHAKQGHINHINGCTRLVQTTQPYLLGDVFGELLAGQDVPRDPNIWEISRYSAIDFGGSSDIAAGIFSSEIALQLMDTSQATVKSMGGTGMVAVTVIGVERLLRQAGRAYHRLGAPKMIDGFPLVAIWIDV